MIDPRSWSNLEEFRTKINRTPYYKTMSMELISVDKRGSILKIKADRKHRNLWGTIHGVVMISIADSTCGLSVWSHLKEGETVATIALHIEYIAPVVSGEIITAQGQPVDQSRRLARAEAVLTNEQKKTVAKCYATFMKSTISQKKDGVLKLKYGKYGQVEDPDHPADSRIGGEITHQEGL